MDLKFLKTKYPFDWDIVQFSDAFNDATSGNPKIKKSDYKKDGLIPVIDQGKEQIGGYYNDENVACKEKLPCILFGDHTKIFKFIDFPFALGADGVKVLAPKEGFDEKFLYYYLNKIKLPNNLGYSRHYKFLKEKLILKPPLKEQKRIAAILDRANAIRIKRQVAIKLLDELLSAIFLKMFGDPITNQNGWPIGTIRDLISEVKYGTSKKASSVQKKFQILRMNNITYNGEIDLTDLKFIDLEEEDKKKYLAQKGDLLFNRTNSKELVGKTAVFDRETPMAVAGYLIRLRTNHNASPHYISSYLNSNHGKTTLLRMCKNILGMANINAQELQEIKIMIPPKSLQDEYSKLSFKVREKKKKQLQLALSEETLFNSIAQRAFRGEL